MASKTKHPWLFFLLPLHSRNCKVTHYAEPFGYIFRPPANRSHLPGALRPHRLAASAFVEGNAVKVILDLWFSGVVGVFGFFVTWRIGITSHGAAEDQILSVRRPERAGLHEPRVVCARKSSQLLFLPIIPSEDAAGRVKNLVEVQMVVVRAEKAVGEPWREASVLIQMSMFQIGRSDRGHHIPAVGRDLRHKAEPLDRKSTRLNSSHLGISYA